jgi:CBS domain-containing protein
MMQSHHVRRLPVTNGSGQLEGVLSIDDIISRAEQGATGGVSYSDTFNTLKAVCKHH